MAGQGELLGGKYRLVEQIGEGGMGTVWLARDEALERDVAVKFLHKTLINDPNANVRFRNEARAAAQIQHPNICGVIDIGEHEGAPFMVMERLRGETLAERITRERSLPPQQAVEILIDVLSALDAAHAGGILHRDLKPENVFLAKEGDRVVPKILDFGVSKFIGDDAQRVKLTRTGALVGTPAYMSPEQALGLDDVDVRSDVWAAGVLLFEMVAGRLPYEAPNYNAMLVKIATEPPRMLESVVPGVDPALACITGRALTRDRNERFPTARAFADALHAWLDGAPIRLAPARVAMPTPRVGTTPMSWAEVEAPTLAGNTPVTLKRSPPRRSWLLPVALAVVLGGGATIVLRASQARHVPAPSLAPVHASMTTSAAAPLGYELRLLNLPQGARVMVNGVEAQPPVRIKGGESARIEVSAPGYERWTQTVTPTGDVALTYEGRPVAQPVPTPQSSQAQAAPAPQSSQASAPGASQITPLRPRPRRATSGGRRRSGRTLETGIATEPEF